jgi:hypothetical protein
MASDRGVQMAHDLSFWNDRPRMSAANAGKDVMGEILGIGVAHSPV